MAARDPPATTAARKAAIEFSVHEYEHDPGASSYGMEAAAALGLDPARVFKTLVVDLDGTLTVCIVPVADELDLRSLGKRAGLADTARAERTTGYVAGGISPLGQRRALPTLVDESALEQRHGVRERGAPGARDRARAARPRGAHARDGAPAAALTQAVRSPRGRAQAVSAASAARATPVANRVGAGRQCGRADRRSPPTSWSPPRASTTAQVRAESS